MRASRPFCYNSDMLPSAFRIAALALGVLAIAACADPIADSPAPSSSPEVAVKREVETPAPTATRTPTPTRSPTQVLTAAPSPSPAPSPAATPPPELAALTWRGALSRIALGDAHTCGLREDDGRAVCTSFTRNEYDETSVFSDIVAGVEYSCGLRDDGAVSCWGADTGLGEIYPPEGAFTVLAGGKRHACALDADGAAACWGWKDSGRASPPPEARFSAIAAGGSHSCGVAEFGNLVCWGKNQYGQSEPREGPFAALALGARHTCALRADGEAVCHGDDSHGQASPPAAAFAQIAADGLQTCGITTEGGLECWGAMSISDRSQKFAFVSVGFGRICALSDAGAPVCWPPPPALADDPLGGRWLDAAVEMFPWPAGGVAVADRGGLIEVHSPEGGEPRTALDLVERTSCCVGERGIYGATLDPEFDRFPFIYIYWQTKGDDPDPKMFEGRVSRFPVTADGDVLEDEELVILRLPQVEYLHFGGAVRFGADGMLYVGLGERAEHGVSWHPAAAAVLASLAGKIIRIDVRGATEDAPYRVPPDNPFVGEPDARPEIWAYGLRNPWRMSFATNGELIASDVGDGGREELSIAERGANLGWPAFEGSVCYKNDARCERREDYSFPIHEYAHEDENCAVIGGEYAPDGKYVFGDYCSGRVWTLERTAPDIWSVEEIARLRHKIIAFGTDADGAVYALTQWGPAIPVSE